MTVYPKLRQRSKKTILLILQGEHHLSLYKEIFAYCSEFNWVCTFPNPKVISEDLINEMYSIYGVQVFTDKATALANFRGIDAVVTTFAVSHAAHASQMGYIALAYELGLPVFELQHGLFQLGISYSERSALVGWSYPNALTSLNAPNFTDQKFVWNKPTCEEDVVIGYPPYSPAVHDCPAQARPREGSVLIATNTHWNIIPPEEKTSIWNNLVRLFKALPEVPFTLLPHPSEVKSPDLQRVKQRLHKEKINNVTIQRPNSRDQFVEMIKDTKMVISMISTMLLDFEMYGLPCVIMPSKSQFALADSLEIATLPQDAGELVTAVLDGYYSDAPHLFKTGALKPFNPDALCNALNKEISERKVPASQAIPLIAKYIAKV